MLILRLAEFPCDRFQGSTNLGSTYRLHRVLMLTCIPGVFSGGRRPSISDDGKQASFTSGRDDVYLVDLEVSGPTAMAAGLSASIMLR